MKSGSGNWKGIVLAGGRGTRLYPTTQVTSKQLLPVYDKPMIYYPLSILMLGGIKDILLISTPEDLPRFSRLLGDGSSLGISISYAEQTEPRGIPEAFIVGEDFIGDSPVSLILGDNLFYGGMDFFRDALARDVGATLFAYPVQNPSSYGVVAFSEDGKPLSIEEKPAEPKSNYALPGLYCFDSRAPQFARELVPSKRGELEIVDLARKYMDLDDLYIQTLGRGLAWLDTGTPADLLEASSFVGTVERRQGLRIGCLEEVAYRMDFISREELLAVAETLPDSGYRDYLVAVAG